jgi:hypothetical protein
MRGCGRRIKPDLLEADHCCNSFIVFGMQWNFIMKNSTYTIKFGITEGQ